ncbi:Orm1 type endoplasmic reticulum protein [Fomitiporia mediterranea MF3/22]|uniref:Orm1 type endoplasmic reticulum protein n=1 Tax=Fomitiporia mediterranea (strain MF3/22) TaxID=694068 RepID=UPI0004408E7E|nr:Orm1 type endoplasmic reticulum protein [Fomitiporia mediterranea MF3/22]EJD01548.1 Orm1 type endoplasmic reticulum protein [Fomitiporia mediterranea MF3/22]
MPMSPAVKLSPIQITGSLSPSRHGVRLKGRPRSNSLVKVEKVQDTQEQMLDQSMYVNVNVEWVNRKGAWAMHPLLSLLGKAMIDSIPGMTPQISWTSVNLLYNALTYLMFHGVTGIPFQSELHSGAYDDLTLWEQIDDGAQYTPAKKWLFCFPIAVFLLSTHYTHYDPWIFAINLTALIFNLLPKLPMFHRKRLHLFPNDPSSSAATPVSASFPPSRTPTPDNSETLSHKKN